MRSGPWEWWTFTSPSGILVLERNSSKVPTQFSSFTWALVLSLIHLPCPCSGIHNVYESSRWCILHCGAHTSPWTQLLLPDSTRHDECPAWRAVRRMLWGTVLPSLSYSSFYRSICKLIKIGYLWIRLDLAKILLIIYRFLGETKEKGKTIQMHWFKGRLSISYTDDVILPWCVLVLWQPRFLK